MRSATKKQQGIYVMLVAVAVLAGITLLNSFNNQSQQRDSELAAEKAAAEGRMAIKNDAIKNLQLTQQYQKYCVKGVERIDSAGDYNKIIYGTTQKTITYYDTDGTRVYCTEGVANPIGACATIAALNFSTAYVCSGSNVASMISGQNGLQVKTQTTGNAVIVDTVLLDTPGYIVIHKNTAGKPGIILANSQLLQPNIYKIVSIAMPTALTTWESYSAMLHKDSGDGNFNATDDTPMLNEAGDASIMVNFAAIKGE